MNLYELSILGVNIKYIVFSTVYRHINVPMACKELNYTKKKLSNRLEAEFLANYKYR